MRPDAIVIGSSEAACWAAWEAASRGLRVVLVGRPGSGPGAGASRMVSRAVARLAGRRKPRSGGRHPGERDVSWWELRSRIQGLCDLERAGWRRRLRALGVLLDDRTARFVSPTQLSLDGERHEAPILILAPGRRPRRPGRFVFDDQVVCDSGSIFGVERPPRSAVVIGGEGQGCEVACALAVLGAQVTVIDRRSRTLRWMDRDVLELLHASVQGMGIEFVLDEWLDKIDLHRLSADPHAVVRLASGRVERCDRLVVAAGYEPATTAELDLRAGAIDADEHGAVVTDAAGRTSNPRVFAVDSAIAGLDDRFEGYHGRMIVRCALGLCDELGEVVPIVVYSLPEIATVGLTQEACQRLDVPHVVGRARYRDTSWGRLQREPRGLVKLLATPEEGDLLGMQVVGSHASELITSAASALRHGIRVQDLALEPAASTSPAEICWAASLDALRQLVRDEVGRSCEQPA